jgi:hypothetical protein
MRYMTERERIDCRQQTIQMLGVEAFGPDGRVFEKADGSDTVELILPNTLALSQYNLVCKGVKPSPETPTYKTLPSAVEAGDAYVKASVFKLPGAP